MSTSQPPTNPNTESLGMLVDPAYERTLQNRVKDLLGWRHDNFPGSQASYFETAHLEYLKSEDYFVCEQNDGIRCLLFTTITPKGPATFVIDSKNSFRYLSAGLPVRDQPTFQHETLLDGELVIEKSGDQKLYRYLICDLIVLNKVLVAHKSFNNRLGMLNQEVILPFNRMISNDPSKRPPFKLELKKMERSYGLKVVLEHKNNGLLFTPVRSPYTCGLSRKLLKWKNPLSYTADLKIKVTYNVDRKPIYSVLATCNLNHKFLDHLQLEPSLFTEWRSSPPDGRIAEFRWDSQWPVTIFEKGYAPKTQKGGWRFVRFRDDKDTANEEEFAKLVREGMPNAVPRDVLEKQVEEIRSNWKIREKSGMHPPSGQSGSSHSQQALHGSHERRPSSDIPGNIPRESPLPSPRHDQGFNRRKGSHDSSRKGSQDSVSRKGSQDETAKKSSPPEDLNTGDNVAPSGSSGIPPESLKPEKSPTKLVFPTSTEVSHTQSETKSPNDVQLDQPSADLPPQQGEKSSQLLPKAPTPGSEAHLEEQNEKESSTLATDIVTQNPDTNATIQQSQDAEVTKKPSSPEPSASNSEVVPPQGISKKEDEAIIQSSDDKELKPAKIEDDSSPQLQSDSVLKPTESNTLGKDNSSQEVASNDKQLAPLVVRPESSDSVTAPTKVQNLNAESTAVVETISATAEKDAFEVLASNPEHLKAVHAVEANGNNHLPEVTGIAVKRKSLGNENQNEPQKHKKLSIDSSPIQREHTKQQLQKDPDQRKQQSSATSLYQSPMFQPQLQPMNQTQIQQNQQPKIIPNQKQDPMSDPHHGFSRVEPAKMAQSPNQRPVSSADTPSTNTRIFSGPQILSSRDHGTKSEANVVSVQPVHEQTSATTIPPTKSAVSYDTRIHGASPNLSSRPSVEAHSGSAPVQDPSSRRASSGNETSLLDRLYRVEPLPTSQTNTQSISHSVSNPDAARLTRGVPGTAQPIQTDQPQKSPHQYFSSPSHPSFQPGANLKSNEHQIRRDSASNPASFDRNSSTGYTHHPIPNSQINPMQPTSDVPQVTPQLGYNTPKEFQRGSPRYGAGYVANDKQPRHSISDIQHHPVHSKGAINNDNREALRRSMTFPNIPGGLKNDTFNASPTAANQQYGKQSINMHPGEAHERDSRGYRPPVDVPARPSQYTPMMDSNSQALGNRSPSLLHQNPLPGYPQRTMAGRSQTVPQSARPPTQPSGIQHVSQSSASSQYPPPYDQAEIQRRPPAHSMMAMPGQYSVSASKSPGYRHSIPHSPGASVQNSPQLVPTRQENWQPMKDVSIAAGYPHQSNPQWPGTQYPYHPSVPVYNSQPIHSTPSQPRSRTQSKGKLDFIMNSSEEEPDWRNTRL
ncbi:hypothetical protein K493DRAFT_340608 [Basidiobolus meristosporus CBS 931.73]|uniref:mRNA guanylyltransferase n=1 Tax=Basidiobolus meristosporus CBS 931.73 TaxID=1314790 RepID=A0A1Y1XUR7_9FUNG|nr:hypothetical protein K493DRAFT_340608 [Basidiobolus meristosporus CBS 931.73]|eukprot:ORX89499.1 hypothetical protein K493DRAFT_340608 [Basidiobolus meristosporus CBS 931.73]